MSSYVQQLSREPIIGIGIPLSTVRCACSTPLTAQLVRHRGWEGSSHDAQGSREMAMLGISIFLTSVGIGIRMPNLGLFNVYSLCFAVPVPGKVWPSTVRITIMNTHHTACSPNHSPPFIFSLMASGIGGGIFLAFWSKPRDCFVIICREHNSTMTLQKRQKGPTLFKLIREPIVTPTHIHADNNTK